MPQLIIPVAGTLRVENRRLPNFDVAGVVTEPFWSEVDKGMTERREKAQIDAPQWSHNYNNGVSTHFRRHNGFNDQERYQRTSRAFVIRQGTFVKYYATSYNPYDDALYHEDNNREVERYFDVPFIITFQPENEIYNRFGIQYLDEFETYLHMALFLELNYASLKRAGVEPACPSTEHNPVWWQRGYEAFRYYGYTAQQIFPKVGDLFKIEAFNTLYTIESVTDGMPDYEFRWRKYWWKLFSKPAYDQGQTISEDVLNDPEQEGFINGMLGTQTSQGMANSAIGPDGMPINTVDNKGNPINPYPFDVACATDKLKSDVLFRPPEVPQDVNDISCDNRFYPCADKFGKW